MSNKGTDFYSGAQPITPIPEPIQKTLFPKFVLPGSEPKTSSLRPLKSSNRKLEILDMKFLFLILISNIFFNLATFEKTNIRSLIRSEKNNSFIAKSVNVGSYPTFPVSNSKVWFFQTFYGQDDAFPTFIFIKFYLFFQLNQVSRFQLPMSIS